MLTYSWTGMKRGVSMMKLLFNGLVVIGLLVGGVSVYGGAPPPKDPCSCACNENQACFWIGANASEMGCCDVDNTTKKIKCS